MAIDCHFSQCGSGAPLFLIHGIGAAKNAWRFMLAALQQHFTVVSYDLRGHGASPKPQGEFGLDELVNDLEALRARLGIEQLAHRRLDQGRQPHREQAEADQARRLGAGHAQCSGDRQRQPTLRELHRPDDLGRGRPWL